MVRIIDIDNVLIDCKEMKIAFKQVPDIQVAGEASRAENVHELLAQTPACIALPGSN